MNIPFSWCILMVFRTPMHFKPKVLTTFILVLYSLMPICLCLHVYVHPRRGWWCGDVGSNTGPGLQDRACEIRPVIGYGLLTIKPFKLSFFYIQLIWRWADDSAWYTQRHIIRMGADIRGESLTHNVSPRLPQGRGSTLCSYIVLRRRWNFPRWLVSLRSTRHLEKVHFRPRTI